MPKKRTEDQISITAPQARTTHVIDTDFCKGEIDDELLQDLYAWIDELPLSRPKKHIHRDFSDGDYTRLSVDIESGVILQGSLHMFTNHRKESIKTSPTLVSYRHVTEEQLKHIPVAEMLNLIFPKLVHLAAFPQANSSKTKMVNWELLNRQHGYVFKTGSCQITKFKQHLVCLICVLLADVVKHFLPTLIDYHNYTTANNLKGKKDNFSLLNRRVLTKLNLQLSDDVIEGIVYCKPGIIEHVLLKLREKIESAIWEMKGQARQERGRGQVKGQTHGRGGRIQSDKPEADQNMPSLSPRRKQEQTHRSTLQHPKKAAHGFDNSETVSALLIQEKEQEVLSKQETIEILKCQVRRLEHLLHLKDMRIEDLQSRIEQSRPTGGGKR